jgi:hypothetical protein
VLPLLRDAVRQPAFQSPQITALIRRLRPIYDSPWTVWGLLALGAVRAVLFLIAYPPAHGADSPDYFLYAAQFEGLDAPNVFSLIYPLYPLLIYLTHYVLGSVYVLILFQTLLSVVQGAIFYWGFRPISPALAFVVALMVLGDAQTGVLYNFTSTEPLYMFSLNAAFCVFLVQVRRRPDRTIAPGDILLGVLLATTLLSRPVGRYLIVPFGVLFLLGTRSVWRTAIMGAVYGVVLVASVLFNRAVFDRLELTGGGDFMLVRPLVKSGLLEADNGPASARLLEMRSQCDPAETWPRCMYLQTGDWPTVRRLYADAYQEMLRTHWLDFARLVFDDFTEFLRLPGQQYGGPITPADAQCEDVEAVTDRNTRMYLDKDWLLLDSPDATYDRLWPIMDDINRAMCPPWPDHDGVREIVDRMALRYRSLSRPRPYLWYAALAAAVLAVPWARRRLLIPVLLAGAVLANHAAASAIMLNVQPRYMAVVNPYKGVLLLALLYIIGRTAARVIDAWLVRRAGSQN